MEIPKSGSRDLDYLFEFSPDQGSGEAKEGVNPVSTTQVKVKKVSICFLIV